MHGSQGSVKKNLPSVVSAPFEIAQSGHVSTQKKGSIAYTKKFPIVVVARRSRCRRPSTTEGVKQCEPKGLLRTKLYQTNTSKNKVAPKSGVELARKRIPFNQPK